MRKLGKWAALTAALVGLLMIVGGSPAVGGKSLTLKRAALGKLKPAYIPIKVHRNGKVVRIKRRVPFISPGTIAAARRSLGLGYTSRSSARAQTFFAGQPQGGPDERGEAADANSGGNGNGNSAANRAGLGISLGTYGCSRRLGNSNGDEGNGHKGNVRVNQDCSFRRQAEETIRYNPAEPGNLGAGQNDSRVGFNQCGIDWSLNNGHNWGDLLPPERQKVNFPAFEEPTASDPNRHTILGGPGTLHTYDAFSDPALTWDSRGRGFFSCVGFDIFSNASLLYVTQSPRGAHGSFYFNLGQFGRPFIVAEDNSELVFHDKNFIVADQNPNSPNRDNVYVTWTVFKFDPRCDKDPTDGISPQYCESPIFGSMSTDHGVHWSTPELISATSDTLCFFGNFFDPTASPHACNFDQGSDPATLPNGDLEVVFNNGNTGPGNPNAQQLGVHCHPTGSSVNGTAHLNCAEPSFVGSDIIQGEATCDFGRGPEECIPGAFIRTNDFPRISPNPSNNTLFVSWQDYQRRDNPAVREYSIQLTRSTDGGLTWEPVKTVNPDTGLDHYFPAVDSCKRDLLGVGHGHTSRYQKFNRHDTSACENTRVGDSYYRTERVPNELTVPPAGFAPGVNPGTGEQNSDYVLSGGTWPNTPFPFVVLSPVFAPPDGIQTGFNGDYSGLTITPSGTEGDQGNGNSCGKGNGEHGFVKSDDEGKGSGCAHPIWSDTRNIDPYSSPERTAEAGGVNNSVVHDEDVFTQSVGLPNGICAVRAGSVGVDRC